MRNRSTSWILAARNHYPLIIFLLFYFLLVFFTYGDYGVAWDEYDVYSRGSALFHYLFGKGWDSSYFLVKDGKADGWVLYDYWYPMICFPLNRGFSLEVYHGLNFCFASLVFIASYELLYFQYRQPFLALLGPVFLLLTPRFLGHIPFTPRDMVFAVTYLTALSALYFFREKTSISKTIVLGLLFGMAQASRLVGLSLYVVWTLFYLYERSLERGSSRHKPKFIEKHGRFVLEILSTLTISFVFMAATWPYLAQGFFPRLLEILGSAYRFPWKGEFLFKGNLVSATDLPWDYLPVWILVSTPIFILFFLAALPFFVGKIRKNRLFVLFGLALGVNLVLIFTFRPVVYLGMRHFLYLLPILVLLASLSAMEFFQNFRKKTAFRTVVVLVLTNMLIVAFHLMRLHPYEYIYFNEFTGGLAGAYGKYEIEYMGTSAKDALAWLEKNRFADQLKTYHVASFQDPFQTLYYLPRNVKFEDSWDKADFLVTLPYSGQHRFKNNLLHSVARESVPLMDIYEK